MALTLPDRKSASPCSTETLECTPASPGSSQSFSVKKQPEQEVVNKEVLSKFIYACAPSRTQRYNFKRTVEDIPPSRVIQPLSISFPTQLMLPPGWEQHIHPEGLPYFVLPLEAGDQMQRIVTEEWMYDPHISKLILDFIKEIRTAISEHRITIWPESDLFLELCREEGKLIEHDGQAYCGYHFVHHPKRCIYWLESFTLKSTTSKSLYRTWGDLSGYQIMLCLEFEYWTYWNNFPTLNKATPEIYDYVIDIILCVMTDVISAPKSACTIYPYETLQRMLNLVRTAKDCNTSSWHIGRFMTTLIWDRIRNYYGSWGTRLMKRHSVIRDKTDLHSWIIDLISPFLFFIPHAQLDRAEALITDRCIILREWEAFFNELKEEWHQTALLATILLTTNCAFLAIPIFQDPSLVTHSSPEQIASYLSLTTSLFGLMHALVMYRQHKTNQSNSPTEILAYIHGTEGENFDHVCWERLFLVWSLPQALIMWSATIFAVAFLLMCFRGTHITTKIIVGVSILVFGLFTLYYMAKFGSGKKILRIWVDRILRRTRDIKKWSHWSKQEESPRDGTHRSPIKQGSGSNVC